MFDLQHLSEWDAAEQASAPTKPQTELRSVRTLQRVQARDDQRQCPFGFTKEPADG